MVHPITHKQKGVCNWSRTLGIRGSQHVERLFASLVVVVDGKIGHCSPYLVCTPLCSFSRSQAVRSPYILNAAGLVMAKRV